MPDLPTPRTTLNHAHVHGHCRACQHWSALDLAHLIEAGRGDVPLVKLPLRCAECGSRDVGIIVSGISGYEKGPDS